MRKESRKCVPKVWTGYIIVQLAKYDQLSKHCCRFFHVQRINAVSLCIPDSHQIWLKPTLLHDFTFLKIDASPISVTILVKCFKTGVFTGVQAISRSVQIYQFISTNLKYVLDGHENTCKNTEESNIASSPILGTDLLWQRPIKLLIVWFCLGFYCTMMVWLKLFKKLYIGKFVLV